VAGVYDKDPVVHADAVLLAELRYMDVLEKRLRVMDSTAVTLAMDNDMPIIVFNMFVPGNLRLAVTGQNVGSVVSG